MLQVELIHMRACDHLDVAAIDQVSYAFEPWDSRAVRDRTKPHSVMAFVAIDSAGAVLGYLVYQVFATKFVLLRLAVHPNFRRRGVGRRLLTKLQSKLRPGSRARVSVTVPETDLDAQRWLRHMEFRAVNVLPSFYGERDGYVFQYRYKSPCPV